MLDIRKGAVPLLVMVTACGVLDVVTTWLPNARELGCVVAEAEPVPAGAIVTVKAWVAVPNALSVT
jgi:hypothetical protein